MNNFKPIKTLSGKLFAVILMGAVIMILPKFVGHQTPSSLVNPQFKIEQFNQIRPKLEQKANNFHIKRTVVEIPAAYAGEDYGQAAAFSVIDADTGQVIADKNLSKELPIASLTKMMTAVVISDLTGPDERFSVSDQAANMEPTRMGVIPGQTWTRDELLNGLLLTSANDVAEAFKENIDQKYGEGTFVQAMNEKAKFLGLKNTHFYNPAGLDEGGVNLSSLEDLTILANYLLKNYPALREIVAKDYQFIPESKDHKQADLYNWNGLLDVYPGASGIKIGNTDSAGYCTIILAERGGKRLLVTVLGAPGVLQRDMWAAEILDAGFSKTANLPLVNVTEDQLKAKYATWKYFQ